MGSLFKGPKMPKMPAPVPVAKIPTVDDAEIQRRKMMKQAEAAARGGRKSTIMTDDPNAQKNTLGAG